MTLTFPFASKNSLFTSSCTTNENVGIFLASDYLEEGKLMAVSKLRKLKKTIMVVDDNPDLVTIIQTMLEVKGFGVQPAYNGQEVFNLLGEKKPDLILLDIMMPQMDGFAVLKQLKGNPGTASIPVILLSAKVLDEDVREGYKHGANYYIMKPFTNTQLLDGINLVFSGGQRHSNRDN
jgi:CheY-like chemotaxis protein